VTPTHRTTRTVFEPGPGDPLPVGTEVALTWRPPQTPDLVVVRLPDGRTAVMDIDNLEPIPPATKEEPAS
jgi:hypothetical protein